MTSSALYRLDPLVGRFAFIGAFSAFVPFVVAETLPEVPLTLGMTTTDPAPGTRVDSSPVDHFIRSIVPLTPVTIPSRGS